MNRQRADIGRRAILRRFAQCATGIALVTLPPNLPRSWFAHVGSLTELDGAARRLIGVVEEVASAKVIGVAYLRQVPAEHDTAILVRKIVGRNLASWTVLARADRSLRRSRLQSQIRHDFAEGRVVEVNGWILAKTEARLFSLAALLG